MQTSRRPLAFIGIALVAAGVAAAGSVDSSRATTSGATAGPGTATAHAAASTTRVNNARRAIKTARTAVRHGRPYDLERDRYHGTPVWEIKVASGSRRPHELLVSNNGRKIVDRRRDDHRGDDARKALQAKIGFRHALLIARRHGSGALSEAEIDRQRTGRIVWTATFERGGTETEVIVDATTGHVVDIRRNTDEKD